MSIRDILQQLQAGELAPEDAKTELARRLATAAPAQPAATTTHDAVPCEPIAIVGMSGRYPGAADLGGLWENLLKGRDSVREVPASRWDSSAFRDPNPPHAELIYCRWLGVLDDIECFDPLFFNISPAEAQGMDPQHRIFLEEAYHAVEDAGYAGMLSNLKCGVYFGVMSNEYGNLVSLGGAGGGATGNSHAIGAARIAYYLNLKGPAIAVDTACSSSLVTTHLACQALRNREIDMAISGGATLYLLPGSYIGMCAAGMLSPQGRCRSFDNSADGFVPGEGAGAIVLKRLADAQAAGDAIHGLIIGSGINQDGKTNGITAPSKNSQIELARDLYVRYKIDPRSVSYVEMHGTGTKLGDPIELEALSAAYRSSSGDRNWCTIGSIKSNIGHTSAAAGVAGIQKILLAMRHRMLVPTLHFDTPNEHFDFAGSPFRVGTDARPWASPPGTPRRAAVSSFGYSGTNAHMVIEEYLDEGRSGGPTPACEPHLCVLSARNASQLRESARRLHRHLQAHGDLELHDVAFTLQVGRQALEHRLAIIAADTAHLVQALERFLAGKADEAIVVGSVDGRRDARIAALQHDDALTDKLRAWLKEGQLQRIGELWAHGLEVDWAQLHAGGLQRRVSLPGYPFEKVQCWLPAAAIPAVPQAAARLHPLLHRNVSSLAAQCFESVFSGEEPFFADHRVQGRGVLSGAACLEMVRAALALSAAGVDGQGGPLRLADVTWLAPLAAGKGVTMEVKVTLRPADSGDIHFEVSSAQEHPQVYCQGGAALLPPQPPPQIDIGALRSQVAEGLEISGEEHYGLLATLGITYGPSCRTVERLCVGSDVTLARLCLPGAPVGAGFILDPALLDGAFQASLGPALAAARVTGAGASQAALPFALDSLEVFATTAGLMWAVVRPGGSTGEVTRFDIDLCDDAGVVCARARGLACRAGVDAARVSALPAGKARPDGLYQLVPAWEPVPHVRARPGEAAAGETGKAPAGAVLVVGGSATEQAALLELLPGAIVLEGGAAPDACAAALGKVAEQGPIGHLICLPAARSEPPQGTVAAGESARRAVLHCFDVVKQLLSLGYWSQPLALTVVTRGVHVVRGSDVADSTDAGLHGLFGSLAKEYPSWSVRVVDLQSGPHLPLNEILSLPWDPAGQVLCWRDQEWYRQQLLPLASPVRAGGPALYRQGGLYVVIGGAGGIGEAWSEWMMRRYQARIVWLGRRKLDAAISAKLRRLGEIGEEPLYISADAADPQALERAYKTIKKHYGEDSGAVAGIVHSAIVLADGALANMPREQFEAAVRAKIDGSVHFAKVFRNEPLDFVAFFSSMQSFQNEAGQSNYAAGCTFSDAYARELAQHMSCPVKVVNWGYWGHVGVVAGEAMRQRMAAAGVGSIEAEEGMTALELLLSQPWAQMAVMKLSGPAAMEQMEAAPSVTYCPPVAPAGLEGVKEALERQAAEASGRLHLMAGEIAEGSNARQLEELLGTMLLVQMRAAGLLATAEGTLADERGRVDPALLRWLDESLRILERMGHVAVTDGRWKVLTSCTPEEAWQEWHKAKAGWTQDPNRAAQVHLVESTMLALPQIITGRQSATDVLFAGSMSQVQGVYQGSAGADHFNTTVARVVSAFLDARLRESRETGAAPVPLRILEVGAGTGATCAAVLAELAPRQELLGEYCYTDVSRAFLVHGQEAFASQHPCVRLQMFDVERPPGAQQIEIGGYDVVIATNVLHATRDIRETVRNAKAALHRNGLLVLNEICVQQAALFTHLTFALTKGWWRFEDDHLRVPGTPGLLPETWQRVLEDEGFSEVLFPAGEAHWLGQQVIVAVSDGVVRQMRADGETADVQSQSLRPHAGRARRALTGSVREQVADALAQLIAGVLKMAPEQIDHTCSLERYGLDSIVAVQLASALSRHVQRIGSTIFLEHPTIDGLTDHLLKSRPAELQGLLGAAQTLEPIPSQMAGIAGHDSRQPLEQAPRRFAVTAAPGLARAGTEIAIIGVAGRYPQARTVEDLWTVLSEGRDCVTEVPAERWDHRLFFDLDRSRLGKTYCRWGSFMDGVDEFDPLFFDISPASAESMDPQVRLCLETTWELLERSGHTRAHMEERYGSRVGVFLGAMYQQYQMFETDYVVNAGVGLSSYSAITNRVSSFFNFKGPSVAVDTQCSSATIAIHMACRSLLDEECEAAVAGGVNLLIHPKKYIGLSIGLMLGSRRESRSFSDADGFLPSEGVGAVLLKPLARAEADGDPILAVIKYSGQSHGGRGIGYGTLDANAQLNLLEAGLRRGGVDPRTITCVEAAANGSPLGDALEAAALTRAYGEAGPGGAPCAIGSVKSNFGHVEAASGIAQLTKVILQLQHRQIAPMLHMERRNPHVNFEGTRCRLVTQLQEWPRAVLQVDGRRREFPRRAAINTFGGGGSLGHLIVEEYAPELYGKPARQPVPDMPGPQVIVVSARSKDRLREAVKQLQAFVERTGPRLVDLAYALQINREPMEHRLAVVVETPQELLAALAAFIARRTGEGDGQMQVVAGERRGGARMSPRARVPGPSPTRAELEELAQYWSNGGEVEWQHLHPRRREHLIGLPTYPFERRRCWLKETERTRYADSFVNGAAPPMDEQGRGTVEELVYRTICAALGLQSFELQLDASLGRYEMLPVFLPRLAHMLEVRAGLRVDPARLAGCRTPREIAAAAVQSDVLEFKGVA